MIFLKYFLETRLTENVMKRRFCQKRYPISITAIAKKVNEYILMNRSKEEMMPAKLSTISMVVNSLNCISRKKLETTAFFICQA